MSIIEWWQRRMKPQEEYIEFTSPEDDRRVIMQPDTNMNAVAARWNATQIYGAQNVPRNFGMRRVIQVRDPNNNGEWTNVTGRGLSPPEFGAQVAALQSFEESGVIGPQPAAPSSPSGPGAPLDAVGLQGSGGAVAPVLPDASPVQGADMAGMRLIENQFLNTLMGIREAATRGAPLTAANVRGFVDEFGPGETSTQDAQREREAAAAEEFAEDEARALRQQEAAADFAMDEERAVAQAETYGGRVDQQLTRDIMDAIARSQRGDMSPEEVEALRRRQAQRVRQ